MQPCENFYYFACGNYLKHHEPPKADFFYWSPMNQNSDFLYRNSLQMLNVSSDNVEYQTDQLVIDHFHSCMDTDQIESLGLDPMKEKLNDVGIGDWPILKNDKQQDSKIWYEIEPKLLEYGMGHAFILETNVRSDGTNRYAKNTPIIKPPSNFQLKLKDLERGFQKRTHMPYFKYMLETAQLFKGLILSHFFVFQ